MIYVANLFVVYKKLRFILEISVRDYWFFHPVIINFSFGITLFDKAALQCSEFYR